MSELTQKFKTQLYDRVRQTVEMEIQDELWRVTVDGSYAGFLIFAPEYDGDEIVDFRITKVNDTAAEQLGMSVNELEGVLINETFPINIEAGYFEQYKQAFLNREPFEREYTIPEGVPGAGNWVQLVTPMTKVLVIRNRHVHTTDALKDLEAELMKDRTELLEKVIREAGHDLRTPMAIIKTSLYLAEKIGADDESKRLEYEQQARDQVDRLNEILEDLVDVAKMKERGMNFKVVSATDFVESVYDDFQGLASEQGRELVFRRESGGSIIISEARMHRAYSNIVKNALTYTDPGDTVTLSAQVVGDDVHLLVEDTGIGINPENLQRIFDRFYRIDRQRKAEEGNSGMGLSIAKEIVDAHGGIIDVKSEEGVGTTFSIILPCVIKSHE